MVPDGNTHYMHKHAYIPCTDTLSERPRARRHVDTWASCATWVLGTCWARTLEPPLPRGFWYGGGQGTWGHIASVHPPHTKGGEVTAGGRAGFRRLRQRKGTPRGSEAELGGGPPAVGAIPTRTRWEAVLARRDGLRLAGSPLPAEDSGLGPVATGGV